MGTDVSAPLNGRGHDRQAFSVGFRLGLNETERRERGRESLCLF